MKNRIAVAFMLFSLVAAAQSEIKMSGALEFGLDQTVEMDGKTAYSMNGDVFGTGDWKQSTTDNPNDNRDKFQAILNLNSEIKVNDKVKLNIGFESMIDELIGKVNGIGATAGQEFATVNDNLPLILKDITAEVNSDFAKITLTNNFNFDFNKRVLAMQFEDNGGEPIAYGEGILAEKEIKDIKTKAFMYQATKGFVAPTTQTFVTTPSNTTQAATGIIADKVVFGIDMKKDFAKGKIGVLAINEHDNSSDVKTQLTGATSTNFDKKLDIHRVAVNGEVDITSKLSLKGEFIRAQYGKDVTKVLNTLGQVSWEPEEYDFSAAGAKDDCNLIDVSATFNATDNLQVAVGYKNVGEDYTAVLGNSQKKDSWLGDASFNYDDGNYGKGYEKGLNAKVSYTLPTNLLIKTTLEAKNYDLTRSELNTNKDVNEQEIKGKVQVTEGKWKTEASYRKRIFTKDTNTGIYTKTDLAFDDMNANGEVTIYDNGSIKANVTGDLNYYIGNDNVINKNFSTETKVKVGTNATYTMSDKLSFTGAYSFGYATEDNDIIKNGSATQNMLTMGLKYKVTGDVAFDLGYKYDNYKYDVTATAAQLTNSMYKKEYEHQWYDGLERWDHYGSEWAGWKNTIPTSFKGYITHQLKASVVVKF